jgi:LPXTG-motif cell wall-anchored protein
MTKQHLRRTKAMITIMAAMAMVLAMSATAAFADYPPDRDFGVTCTPQNPTPGSTLTGHVSGAESREGLQITATASQSGVVYQDSTNANPAGRHNFRVSTDGLAGQTVTISVTGETSGTTTTQCTVREDPRVRGAAGDRVTPAPAATERLPVTGGQALLLSLIGLSLVGGGLLALRKRGDSVA